MKNKPSLIEFKKIGSSSLGFISVAEFESQVPFPINRVYWTYFTPNEIQRGFHAHKELCQVIVAVSGNIKLTVVNQNEEKELFILDTPSIGLYIPKMYWREISFSHNAVLLCLASEVYNENDYIRDYKTFLKFKND
tara:strand:+ start:18541 stop:18948 length:408 start_codon:yes stop_codon:yes gene_type:complete